MVYPSFPLPLGMAMKDCQKKNGNHVDPQEILISHPVGWLYPMMFPLNLGIVTTNNDQT